MKKAGLGLAIFLAASCAFAQSSSQPVSRAAVSTELKDSFDDMQRTLGRVPTYFREMAPQAVPGMWQEIKSIVLNPRSALPQKYKSLISLAVSSQLDCKNCLFFDMEVAKMTASSTLETKEAIAMAGLTRHWSTFLNGSQIDPVAFRKETDEIFKDLREKRSRAASEGASTSEQQAGEVSSEKEMSSELERTYADIQETLGRVPLFLRDFPRDGIIGAWKEMKALQLSPSTAIPPKYKELIGLAVAAQIPCSYCTIFHTEAAKLHGASSEEVKETLALASISRQRAVSAVALSQDDAAFRRETLAMMKYVRDRRVRQQLGGAAPRTQSAQE